MGRCWIWKGHYTLNFVLDLGFWWSFKKFFSFFSVLTLRRMPLDPGDPLQETEVPESFNSPSFLPHCSLVANGWLGWKTKTYFPWPEAEQTLNFVYALEFPAGSGWVWAFPWNYMYRLVSSPFLFHFPHSFNVLFLFVCLFVCLSVFPLITHLNLNFWLHIWFWENVAYDKSLWSQVMINYCRFGVDIPKR